MQHDINFLKLLLDDSIKDFELENLKDNKDIAL
jgi:hypothetical protein